MDNILEKIAESVQKRVKAEQAKQGADELKAALARQNFKPKDWRSHLNRPGYHVIAEVKLASPSRGDIAPQLEPVEVARQYLSNGAAALSVLTEPEFFKGDLSYLRSIRSAFPEAYLLQKDFIIDPYQLYQAKLAGADAILIIVALLGETASFEILKLARQLSLSALVEVHNAEEMAIAGRIGADLIGINNRNLKDMSISLDTSRSLLPLAPKSALLVSESGIEEHGHIRSMYDAGFKAFLVGSSLMQTGTPGAALARLLQDAN